MSDPTPPVAPPPLDAQPVPSPPLDQPYYRAPLPDAIVRFWRKYATFAGRASRAEYWWWVFATTCVAVVLSLVSAGDEPLPRIATVLRILWLIATAVPTAALTWRRVHDTNHSGWWAIPPLAANAYTAVIGELGLQPALNAAMQSPDHVLAVASTAVSVVSLLCLVELLVFALLPPSPAGTRFDA